jgi:UDP-N-acetylmuramoyl-tripeptide--D-alanyl-D-alanine ligase
MQTKGELYDYLRRTGDRVFLNVDNPYLCRMAADRELHNEAERPGQSLAIPYGVEYMKAEVLPSSPEYPFLRISIPGTGVVNTNLVGSYNADNVMAALAVGQYFGISLQEGIAAIQAYVPSNNRSQMTRTQRNTLIVDAYNANPTSMEAALRNFANVQADRKVALLGDMLELGADSAAEHQRIAGIALELGLEMVCFVGKEFTSVSDAMKGTFRLFDTSADLAGWLADHPLSDAVVLIKGSRGIRMEKVMETL